MSDGLQQHWQRFRADPRDEGAFSALEEHLFVRGDWTRLLGLYRQRLAATPDGGSADERATLLVRLGQTLERDGVDPGGALRCYRRAIELAPRLRAARVALRQAYAAAGSWDEYVQTAEAELALPMPVRTRSALHRECAQVWLNELGDVDQALCHFRLAAEDAPHDGDVRRKLADTLEATGRHAEAADAFGRAADHLSGEERVAVLLARARLLAGALAQPDEAIQAYRQALTEDPEQLEALRALAPLVERQRGWKLADELYERWFEREPEDAVRANSSLDAARAAIEGAADPARARVWLARALRLHAEGGSPPAEPILTLALAGAALARGQTRPSTAADLYQLALQVEPDHPVALAGLGESRYEQGDLAGAERALVARLEHPDRDANRSFHLSLAAAALEARGENENALARYREVLALDPDLETAHSGVSRLLAKAGRFREAAEALAQRAARAWNAAERARRFVRAAELVSRERDGEERAIAWLREAVTLDPKSQPGWSALVRELYQAGCSQEALAAIDDALRHIGAGRDHTQMLLTHAALLEESGETRAAARSYARVADADPSASDAALCASRLLASLGDWSAASAVLEAFASRHAGGPPRARARVWCALAQLRAGPLENLEGGIAAYQRALRAEPDSSEPRIALARLLAFRAARRRGWLGRQTRRGLGRVLTSLGVKTV